jgi:hypothetical protein
MAKRVHPKTWRISTAVSDRFQIMPTNRIAIFTAFFILWVLVKVLIHALFGGDSEGVDLPKVLLSGVFFAAVMTVIAAVRTGR